MTTSQTAPVKSSHVSSADHLSRISSKIKAVPIGKIKIPPVHVTQRPFRPSRGDRYAANLDLNKLGYPVVNYRDGVFWCFDGQHRIYALKKNGFGDADLLECEVFEGLSDQQMADMFLGRNDSIPVAPLDRFMVACTAGRTREVAVRNTVEGLGLRLSAASSDRENIIVAVAALNKVYDTAGVRVLAKTLRALKTAYGGDCNAFKSAIIEGVAMVFHRYGDHVNAEDLTARLAASSTNGVNYLQQRAHGQRNKTGAHLAQCVASVVVDAYNKGLPGRSANRLPDWWKQHDGAL